LVEVGKANLDAVDDGGMTPLMYAVAHLENVKYLIVCSLLSSSLKLLNLLCSSNVFLSLIVKEKKANISKTDRRGRSALFHALAKRHEETAKVLIHAGADPYQKDNEGRAPIELVSPSFKVFNKLYLSSSSFSFCYGIFNTIKLCCCCSCSCSCSC
jgi:ankyrin repeat protein